MAKTYRAGLIAAWLLACLAQPAYALDEAEQRGKQIYLKGTSARGTLINAIVGTEQTLIPAAAIPCANCHGYDGLGRPEGGVVPTDVRWSQLSKTYGHVHDDGRRHDAFDDESLTRSIIAGVDPANNRLDASMPLYLLSQDDAADLVAYLKVLEHDLDPGIEEDRVRVASLLPLDGRAAALGQAMDQVMRGYFADVNSRGGIFGRQIELVTVPLAATPEATLLNLEETFNDQGIFAMVGGYTIGLDDALLQMLRYDKIPLIGPFTLDPGDELMDAAAFYLYPGFNDQVRVLADQAFDHAGESGRIFIANSDTGQHDELVGIAQDQLRHLNFEGTTTANFVPGGASAAGLAARIGETDTDSLIFFGAQEDLESLLVQLAIKGLTPNVHVLSSYLARSLYGAPKMFDQKIFVAYPTLASDVTDWGRQEYQDLAARHDLPTGSIQGQLAAFAAARVLVEGLRGAGRDLDRTRLVKNIEDMYQWETGVTPPLTFGPNRRIGARGAHVMVLDLEGETMSPVGDSWHDVR